MPPVVCKGWWWALLIGSPTHCYLPSAGGGARPPRPSALQVLARSVWRLEADCMWSSWGLLPAAHVAVTSSMYGGK